MLSHRAGRDGTLPPRRQGRHSLSSRRDPESNREADGRRPRRSRPLGAPVPSRGTLGRCGFRERRERNAERGLSAHSEIRTEARRARFAARDWQGSDSRANLNLGRMHPRYESASARPSTRQLCVDTWERTLAAQATGNGPSDHAGSRPFRAQLERS